MLRGAAKYVLGGAIILYLVACVALYAAMRQPPERFGAIMAKVPRLAMRVLPFPLLWKQARAGPVSAGDAAPDFTLPTLHQEDTVTLSEVWRERPVVLVFGSYT
jgi:hypothetical protein